MAKFQKLGIKAPELVEKFVASGYLGIRDGEHYLTVKGKEIGGEFRMSPKFGSFSPEAHGFRQKHTLLAGSTRFSLEAHGFRREGHVSRRETHIFR